MNPPVPTVLKLLRGNPGKRSLNEDEPQPPSGAEMPDYLTPEAAAHWPKVSTQLADAGVLTEIDQTALAMYCEAFAMWRHASDQVAKFGAVVKSPSGYPVQSPYLSISNRAYEQMLRLLGEFGMTPSARTRVVVARPQKIKSRLDAIGGGK